MPHSRFTFAVTLTILLVAARAEAQNQAGGATFGGPSGFGTGAGPSNFGASSFGGGAFGTPRSNGGGFGAGQTSGQNTSASSGANLNAGYVGRGGNTTFVGRGLSQPTNNNRFNRPRTTSSGQSNQAATGGSQRPPVRVRLRPSDEVARPRARPPTVSISRLRMPGVTIQTRDGVTRLEGIVDTPSQRLVAEKFVSLEPGIGRIENRLRLRAEAVEQIPPPQ